MREERYAIKVLKRRIKSCRSDNCEISLSASSMLALSPLITMETARRGRSMLFSDEKRLLFKG
jgi:hypothetical protein